MKIIENVTIYKCDHCGKELKRKHSMIKHEDLCFSNPKNQKACYGCIYFEETKIDTTFLGCGEYGEKYNEKTVKCFRCTKLDKLMFPYSIERKELHLKYDHTFEGQEAMPKECEGYRSF